MPLWRLENLAKIFIFFNTNSIANAIFNPSLDLGVSRSLELLELVEFFFLIFDRVCVQLVQLLVRALQLPSQFPQFSVRFLQILRRTFSVFLKLTVELNTYF